jgi:hypothetical protein
MLDPNATTVRMLNEITWEYGGNVTTFYRGQIVSSIDPRAAGGFTHVALDEGWAEQFNVGPTLNRAKPGRKGKR